MARKKAIKKPLPRGRNKTQKKGIIETLRAQLKRARARIRELSKTLKRTLADYNLLELQVVEFSQSLNFILNFERNLLMADHSITETPPPEAEKNESAPPTQEQGLEAEKKDVPVAAPEEKTSQEPAPPPENKDNALPIENTDTAPVQLIPEKGVVQEKPVAKLAPGQPPKIQPATPVQTVQEKPQTPTTLKAYLGEHKERINRLEELKIALQTLKQEGQRIIQEKENLIKERENLGKEKQGMEIAVDRFKAEKENAQREKEAAQEMLTKLFNERQKLEETLSQIRKERDDLASEKSFRMEAHESHHQKLMEIINEALADANRTVAILKAQ